MKKILITLLGLFAANFALAQFPDSYSSYRNFVMETKVKTPNKKNAGSLYSLPVDSANWTVNYFDGLGRPMQAVQWKASPAKRDIVQHIEYDAFGREIKKYQPYAEGSTADASFRTSALGNLATFYGTSGLDPNVAKTPYPFSQTVFEPSPMNRPTEQGFPGAAWQPYSSGISGSGHTVKTVNGTNAAGEVALWTVGSSGASSSTHYPFKSLYKTVSKDEDWASGKAGTVAEFKDMEGRVVLKRQWLSDTDSLSTHYIYDDYGNLRYVVPPAVTATSFSETSDTNFSNYIYAYHYDGLKRMIEKKVPGKGWEYMVYNKLHQVVLTQDANQRTINQWSFTKYDAMGRTVITGIVASSSNRDYWQSAVDAQTGVLWESRTSNGGTDYTDNVLPQLSGVTLLTISYYDDYNFREVYAVLPPTYTVSTRTKGLATGTRVWTSDGATSTWTMLYYDDEGRVAETVSTNHLGGSDRVLNTYNFAGQLTSTTRSHNNGPSVPPTIIVNTFVYDHVGRKVSTKQNINSQGEVTLSRFTYNEIGQLWKKSLHGSDTTFKQHSYTVYNERGWMKESRSAEFRMQLDYQDGTYPRYNGNIANQRWGSSLGNVFTYQYDKLNRLRVAASSGVSMSEAIDYDKMGNISSMNRDNTPTDANYSYSGNQLTGISGGGLTTGSYAYDANGNATTDGRNGVTLTYNHLNLPISAAKSGLSVAYTYDATGNKLKKVSSSTGTTDYVDGIVYTNGSIDFIQTEEGRALNNAGTYTYQYNLTDHLGNVRYSFDIYGGAVRKLQEDDYYAFGKRYGSGGVNKFLYNGKELQEELGQYDYGARFYDAEIGRWNVVDPMASSRDWLSPYNYVQNNPIMRVDPDGMIDNEVLLAGRNMEARMEQARIERDAQASEGGDGQGGPDPKTKHVGRTMVNSPGVIIGKSGGELTIREQMPVSKYEDVYDKIIKEWEAEQLSEFIDVRANHINTLTGKLNGSGAIEPNYFFENLIIGGKLLEGAGMLYQQIAGKTITNVGTFELQITHGITKNKKQMSALIQDISKNGIKSPIKYVAYKGEKYVVNGHHRLRAAKLLDLKSVPAQKVNLPYGGYKTTQDLIYSRY